MKVVFAHEVFPPESRGGGEILTSKLAKGLQSKGHEVKVLTTGNPNIKNFEGVSTRRIPINRYLSNFSIPFILKHAKDANLIHTSSGNMAIPSYFAAKLLNKPICCHIHHLFGDYWKVVRPGITGELFKKAESFIMSRDFDAFVFQNSKSIRIGEDLGVDKSRIKEINPGIDYERWDGSVDKEPIVLFVGSSKMSEETVKIKGLDRLMKTAKILEGTKFIVVGGGEGLRLLKKRAPDNVEFKGRVFGESLIELYNRALVFCLPSLTEGFGMSILEAMASGCAIVSTIDIGQEGLFTDPNPAKISEAIQYLMDNKEDSREIGRRNKEIAKEYTWDRFIESYKELYRSLVDGYSR